MTRATPWILVDLLNQRVDGVNAIAHHFRRVAPRGSHKLIAHHQQTKIIARQITLDQNLVAKLLGCCIGLLESLTGGDID